MGITDLIAQMMQPATTAEGAQISEPPRITFPTPKGVIMPEGGRVGDIFNVTASVRVDEAGLMELVQINGIPVDPNQTIEGSEADANPSSPSALGDGVTNQTSQSQMEGGKLPRNMLNFLMANRASMRR